MSTSTPTRLICKYRLKLAGAAAVDAFAATVAPELKDGKRINTISLSLVKEAAEKHGLDNTGCTPVARVAESYIKSALDPITGQHLPAAA